MIVLLIVVGTLMIVGSKRGWKWLVDPPPEYWAVYSHSFIQKFFGKTALLYFNYIVGTAFILLGLFGIWNTLIHGGT